MATQYSHKQFFRHMPNMQLAEYFDSKSIELNIKFDELKENDTEKVFNVFIELSEDQQATTIR